MRKLKINDFHIEFAGNNPYWAMDIGEIQICLERCLNGWDVAIYKRINKHYELIYRKTKAHHTNPIVAKGLALEAANRLWGKYQKATGIDV